MSDPTSLEDDDAATRQGGTISPTDGGASTEVDPYATALPSAGEGAPSAGGTLESTEVDPYATRFGATTQAGSGGATQGGPHGQAQHGAPHVPRYRPLRLHAKGGLGEIYVAVDAELNREVALKEIQAKHVDQLDNQFRFVFEAEITGGLEHPGIVPVYGLGRYSDGRPYYAMRFIRGDSLRAALKRFHTTTDGGHPPDIRHSLEFRQLLTRFVAVCQAIDYAHSRGVIHRDIKPENVMLGPHGETLVVDWGLAKALDRPEPHDQSSPGPLRPLSGSDGTGTMIGSVMGTPSFMSPEQAAGEIATLGPASDIFSLGSTLYALLVGHAPFRDKSMTEIVEDVKRADFPAPRRINRLVPPALEAICLKAMALRPADRYATASLLASDLERWMADEPVSAYREPAIAKMARWARRHRTACTVALALILTGSAGLGVSNVLIGRERARAERNYRSARSAVEEMLTRVGEVDLAEVPQMEAVRRDLLGRALGFYLGFFRERAGDSAALLEAGRAYGRLGDIREMLGEYVQAEADYRDAIRLLEGPAPSADVEIRRALARARAGLGVLLKKSNRFVESEAQFREALRDRLALATGEPEDTRALASTRYQLGTLLARLQDRSSEDEAAYREAIREQQALASGPSDRPEDRRELARYLNNLGILQSGSDPDAAEKSFNQARDLLEKLGPASANNPAVRWQMARASNNLAVLYFRANLLDEAEPALTRARDGFDRLAEEFPRVPDYRRELALALNNLGQLLERRPPGPSSPADLLRRAIALQRMLVADFEQVPDHKLKLAITLLHLGALLQKSDAAQSEGSFAEAIAIQRKLVDAYPQVPEYRAALGRTLTERAALLSGQGRKDKALAVLDEAIPVLDEARRGNPRDQNYVRILLDAHHDRGELLSRLGPPAALAEEAVRIAAIAPERFDVHLEAARYLARASQMTDTPPDRREPYARDAVQSLRRAFDRGAKDPTVLDGSDFAPLKDRDDFKKLRDEWQSRGKKAVV